MHNQPTTAELRSAIQNYILEQFERLCGQHPPARRRAAGSKEVFAGWVERQIFRTI